MLNWLLSLMIKIFPKKTLRPLARKYIAGDVVENALILARKFNGYGLTTNIGMLGHNFSTLQAESTKDEYLKILEQIETEKLNCTVTVQPSQLGTNNNDLQYAEWRILQLARKSKDIQSLVFLGSEDSESMSKVMGIYNGLAGVFPIGVTLEAGYKRSLDDLLIYVPNNIRICGHIFRNRFCYDKDETIKNFKRLVRTSINIGSTISISTHNLEVIKELEQWMIRFEVPKNQYEFEIPYGTIKDDSVFMLAKKGHNVRIFIPYGRDWYSYYRKILEN